MDNIWSQIWQSESPLTIAAVVVVAAAIGLVTWGAKHWIEALIKASLDKSLEDYKSELKTHEQTAKIAEYASLAIDLKDTDDRELYRRANQLSWELFLWLPDDVYRKLGRGLTNNNNKDELGDAMINVRILLLVNKAGTLRPAEIIVHKPKIGLQKPAQ